MPCLWVGFFDRVQIQPVFRIGLQTCAEKVVLCFPESSELLEQGWGSPVTMAPQEALIFLMPSPCFLEVDGEHWNSGLGPGRPNLKGCEVHPLLAT